MSSAKTATVRKTFMVPVSGLYRAWTQAEKVKAWLAPGTMKVKSLSVDPQVGGAFKVEMREITGESVLVDGRYKLLKENEKIVIEWQWRGNPLVTELTVEFEPLGADQSEMHITHGVFASMDDMQNHQNGWQVCMEKLAIVL